MVDCVLEVDETTLEIVEHIVDPIYPVANVNELFIWSENSFQKFVNLMKHYNFLNLVSLSDRSCNLVEHESQLISRHRQILVEAKQLEEKFKSDLEVATGEDYHHRHDFHDVDVQALREPFQIVQFHF